MVYRYVETMDALQMNSSVGGDNFVDLDSIECNIFIGFLLFILCIFKINRCDDALHTQQDDE